MPFLVSPALEYDIDLNRYFLWLTPAEYRRWRDTGLRGYRADGLPDAGFRGRWASRNARTAPPTGAVKP